LEEKSHSQSAPPKDEVSPLQSGRRVIDSFGSVIFFVVVVEIIILAGLNLYQKKRVETLTSELAAKQAQLNSPENATLNRQIDEVIEGHDALSQVLNSKVAWSKFYGQLNTITPKNVRFTSVSVSDSGSFRADGVTTSLSDLGRAIVAWQVGTEAVKTPFTSLTLSSNGYVTSGEVRLVNFSVTGEINMGLL